MKGPGQGLRILDERQSCADAGCLVCVLVAATGDELVRLARADIVANDPSYLYRWRAEGLLAQSASSEEIAS